MANPSKSKGTKAETDLVNWFHRQGETQVERHAPHGSRDVGDVNGIPSLVVSVKMRGRDQRVDMSKWLRDLATMRINSTPHVDQPLPSGLLVVRRTGYPDPGDWYAVQRVADWWELFGETLT